MVADHGSLTRNVRFRVCDILKDRAAVFTTVSEFRVCEVELTLRLRFETKAAFDSALFFP